MKHYVATLRAEFARNRNPQRAAQQAAYLKGQFVFFGLSAQERRQLSKPFFQKAHLPPKNEAFELARLLWSEPERECSYFAIDLLIKHRKRLELADLPDLEYLITHQSWWDTVDIIATNLVGACLRGHPQAQRRYVDAWLASGNLWLQRTALLFQLKYRDQLDPELLRYTIHALLGSQEFFINKAIGWMLREYGKTHPEWVWDFVEQTELTPLSRREALKRMGESR